MRIAQRTISRNYLKQLNTSMSKKAGCLERSTSGLKFSKLSENVADGTRAMHIQEERYQSQQQLSTVNDLVSEFKSVDSNMDSIQSILQNLQEKVLAGMSENYGQNKRDILAKEISSCKEQILQFANAQFGGKYLFAGTNNSDAPFTVDATSGKLQFNGIDVDQISYQGGAYVYPDPSDPSLKKVVPNSGNLYADIGLGLKVSSTGTPDSRTAFEVSFQGLELMGYGASTTGENGTNVSSNVYDLLTQIEASLTSGYDGNTLKDAQTKLVKLTDKVGMQRTELGTRDRFLERMQTRLTNDIENMSAMESELISSKPADEAIKLQDANYVWKAILQLGSQILPSSLLDYIR
ncbi:MAG: flagellar hook-associated protein 3 FlgL [Clostridiales bacterium]|jgi:flagellin-like hook-associated protein FlgL|nr:flagellar hook-associated protein 3 FlgL [Clostridiales bacterium]